MRNNIIFAGCSFTWGQGLWSYMETDEYVPTVDEYIFKQIDPPTGYAEFRDNNRFAGIVSNSLNKNQVVKLINGGTDNESLDFIKYVFDKEPTEHKFEFPSTKYNYDEVSDVIFQTTQSARSQIQFTYNNCEYLLSSPRNGRNLSDLKKIIKLDSGQIVFQNMYDLTELYCWMYDNEYEVDDVIKMIQNSVLVELENSFKFLESQGIKTHIICWTDEYLDYIHNNNFLKNRLIKITYNSEDFLCIDNMFRKYPKFIIKNDSKRIHESGPDEHPSLECHKTIANSILNVLTK